MFEARVAGQAARLGGSRLPPVPAAPHRPHDDARGLDPAGSGFEYELYRPVLAYWQHHAARFSRSSILCGDFNSNSIWGRPRRAWNHTECVAVLGQPGFRSLYHAASGEAGARDPADLLPAPEPREAVPSRLYLRAPACAAAPPPPGERGGPAPGAGRPRFQGRGLRGPGPL